MRKISTFLIALLIVLNNSVFFGINNVFAVTDSYDFSDATDYTISDTDSAYIHGGAAKLKWSLAHRWHLENGPWATDWATNIIVEWNYAYVTGYWAHAVTSIDISDPTNMSHAGYIWWNNVKRLYWAYDLVKVWNYIYVVSYSGDSLEVIDATDPTDLQHKWRQTNVTEAKLNWARAIDVVWNYAYIASYIDDAIQILDISNPALPVVMWYLQDDVRLNWTIEIEVIWDYAYMTSYTNDSLQVIDISDPLAPVFAWELVDDNITELNWAWWMDIVWNYAYIAWYIDDGLEIVDISDPTNPTHVSWFDNTISLVRLNGARNVTVKWNYAYVSSSVDDSIQVIDISDPTAPTHAWFYDTNNFWILDAIFDIEISGTDIFVTSYNNATVMSFDITDPTTPVFQNELESWPTRLGNPIWLVVEWDYAYVASYWSSWLEILNITDTANPTHQWTITDDSSNNELWWPWDLSKKWDYVYVSAYWDSWLEVVDVSDPSNPVGVAKILDNSTTIELQNPRGSTIEWNFLYATGYSSDSLQIIDISNPLAPVARWFFKDSIYINWAQDVRVSWDYAYVTWYISDNIAVLNISDPDNITFVTEIKDWWTFELNGSWNLDIHWNYLYVISYIDHAIVTIDITDPTNPIYMWDMDDDWSMRLLYPRWIVHDEWYAYVSTWSNDSVVIIDVSDPSDPIHIDEIYNTDLYDTSTQIDKQNNDLFFTQYYWSSLSVVRESYPTNSPYIIPDNHINSDYFNSLNITLWEFNEWNVTFQLSKDNWVTWYYYNWVAWVATTSGTIHSNSQAIVNTNIAGFNVLPWTDEIKWKAFLNSDGTQKVEIDKIEIDYFDNVAPVIDSAWPTENLLIPKHNFDMSFTYFDVDGAYWSGAVTENNGWVWIDTTSADLELYRWNGSSWWADIASTYVDLSATVWTQSVDYPTTWIPFWKYKVDFDIEDLNGNTVSTSKTFYIDEPEFIISTPEIWLWTLTDWILSFSDTVTITVKTIWAPFEVSMNPQNNLIYSSSNIIPWDWTIWFGYDTAPYINSLTQIWTDQNIAIQAWSINTDWEKNTYTYDFKVWALIDLFQTAWDYSSNLDFKINLDY